MSCQASIMMCGYVCAGAHKQPAVEDSNRPSMQLDSKSTTRNTLMVDKLDIDMAEFAYNEQKGERNPKAELNEEFAKYGANWPCFWGETAVGKC